MSDLYVGTKDGIMKLSASIVPTGVVDLDDGSRPTLIFSNSGGAQTISYQSDMLIGKSMIDLCVAVLSDGVVDIAYTFNTINRLMDGFSNTVYKNSTYICGYFDGSTGTVKLCLGSTSMSGMDLRYNIKVSAFYYE